MSVRNILDATTNKIASSYLPDYIPNDLLAPVEIQAEAPGTAGNPIIYVNGNNTDPYGGSFALIPGANSQREARLDGGLTIRTAANGVIVEVGADGNTGATGPYLDNQLFIAGRYGVSQVYDGVYNQPVGLVPITVTVANYPPQVGNTGEIFRSTTFTGPLQQNQGIYVPQTGWYMLQTEVRLGGGAITLPGIPAGVPGAISVALIVQSTSTTVPYAVQTISANTLYSAAVLALDNYVFQSIVYLTAATNYLFNVIGSPNSGWVLGTSGQIKSELISMNQ